MWNFINNRALLRLKNRENLIIIFVIIIIIVVVAAAVEWDCLLEMRLVIGPLSITLMGYSDEYGCWWNENSQRRTSTLTGAWPSAIK